MISRSSNFCAVVGVLFLGLTATLPVMAALPPLTLQDAILLALRNNPQVQSAKLDRVVSRYAVVAARHAFQPQLSLNTSITHSNGVGSDPNGYGTQFSVMPQVTWHAHTGTDFSLSTDYFGHLDVDRLSQMTWSIRQSLLKGFGRAVVDAALKSAEDSEESSRLSLKNSVMGTVTTVIHQYLNVVQAQETLRIDQASLETYRKMIENDKKWIVAGRKAVQDQVQTQAQWMTQKTVVENDLRWLYQAQGQLLQILGLLNGGDEETVALPSNLSLESIADRILEKRPLASLSTYVSWALENSSAYRQYGFTLRLMKRNVQVAQSENRWDLQFSAGGTFGRGYSHHPTPSNFSYHRDEVQLSLFIPIDNVSAKQALLNARVALEQSEVWYQDLRRQIVLGVRSGRDAVESLQAQLALSKKALELKRQVFKAALLKNQLGRISTFELLNTQEDVTRAEQGWMGMMVSYIHALADFDQTIGTVLKHWDISVEKGT